MKDILVALMLVMAIPVAFLYVWGLCRLVKYICDKLCGKRY